MENSDSIFIAAGDPSADGPGKNLIEEILRLCPGLEVFGLGGPRMQAAGLEPLVDHRELAVLGFWEIVPKIAFFRALLRRSAAEILRRRPRAIILIDYPGFNLRLVKKVKSLGIPIIYYVSPQVWAWGGRRVELIRETVDMMLVIFPFEEEFYRRQGIKARFVGHPIVDRFRDIPDKAACRERMGIDGETPLIVLLPGSRTQEVRRMLPTMAKAAGIINRYVDRAAFLVAGIESVDRAAYHRTPGMRGIEAVFDRTPELIQAADFVITSSGTATIETAYFMKPMVVIYKTGFLSYQIAKRMVTLDSIAMVNIVAGRGIVPELIQAEATGHNIAREVVGILRDRERYDRIVEDLRDVRNKLGEGNAAQRAADAIREVASPC